jgi:hypothetical protein
MPARASCVVGPSARHIGRKIANAMALRPRDIEAGHNHAASGPVLTFTMATTEAPDPKGRCRWASCGKGPEGGPIRSSCVQKVEGRRQGSHGSPASAAALLRADCITRRIPEAMKFFLDSAFAGSRRRPLSLQTQIEPDHVPRRATIGGRPPPQPEPNAPGLPADNSRTKRFPTCTNSPTCRSPTPSLAQERTRSSSSSVRRVLRRRPTSSPKCCDSHPRRSIYWRNPGRETRALRGLSLSVGSRRERPFRPLPSSQVNQRSLRVTSMSRSGGGRPSPRSRRATEPAWLASCFAAIRDPFGAHS